MDFSQNIKDAECKLSRLVQQREQEAAMLEVLPARYERNMAAFEKYMPEIHAYFKNYQPTRAFRLFCNENGIPNILWLDEQVSLYGENPFFEAQNQIFEVIDKSLIQSIDFAPQWHFDDQIHIKYNNEITKLKSNSNSDEIRLKNLRTENVPLALMYGIGLGYQLGYLYEQCTVRNLFAFEPDVDLFYASLFCFDWAPLLDYMEQESLSLHLFIGVDEKVLVSDMMEALHRKGAFWSASYFSFCHYHSNKIYSIIEKVEREFYLLRTGWGFFDDNILALAHSHTHLKDGTPFLKKQKNITELSSTPVFVVGNGPSLDQSIEFIRKYKNQALIIACGTAVSALYKADIKPDIYVAVERTKSSADFLSILDAKNFLKDVVFLSVDVIHPKCKEFFRKTGIVFKPNEPMYQLLGSHFGNAFEYDSIEFSNPFVGNTGLNYAALLGFKNIYLFGIDNGYKSAEQHHSKLSLYYNEKQEAKYHQNLADTFPGRGNFGGEVRVNNLFGLSIHNMECLLQHYPDINCINTSDGSYIEGATPVRVETIVPNWPDFDKSGLVDEILAKCFQPFDVTSIDFQSAISVPFCHDLIDKFLNDWISVPKNHNDVLALMQRHHEYLLYIFMSHERHIYRVFIGSINYFYANIISVMMAYLGKEELTKNLESAVGILERFFIDAKKIYAEALERHDETYFVGLDVFKRK